MQRFKNKGAERDLFRRSYENKFQLFFRYYGSLRRTLEISLFHTENS